MRRNREPIEATALEDPSPSPVSARDEPDEGIASDLADVDGRFEEDGDDDDLQPTGPETQVMRSSGLSEHTAEFDVEDAFAAERAPQVEDAEDDDVLEETPEFLQDTPDHDRLWFEQRPPRDFDFDG